MNSDMPDGAGSHLVSGRLTQARLGRRTPCGFALPPTHSGSPWASDALRLRTTTRAAPPPLRPSHLVPTARHPRRAPRSEEHTSELQSRLHLVCRLLLEKKKK